MEKFKFLKLRVTEDQYDTFQNKCEEKDKTMSKVLRTFTDYYVNSENLAMVNLSDGVLKSTISLCKKKKLNFNDLIIELLNNEIKKE